MSLDIQAQTVPLRTEKDKILVGNTRVRLDTVVYAFNQGYTAEEIVQDFPTLNLADVYTVIAYYLNNRSHIDAYIGQKERNAQTLKEQIESKSEYKAFRYRILNRWEQQQQ